ncbi:hypothetical protein EYF80_052390 [Liparis tanakae]|uniref:Uncharacterized protein n=1 Tax=Liparis tanakae TaxID=230148 RepID=A0A4Z2F900_9TELE|nr:hypothetical protein EYF80_052390 [Liparis tanakae]
MNGGGRDGKTRPPLTASSSGLTPRYFPLPQPTSASTAPAGSAARKWQTRGQGEWRVALKSEAMASYTRCTYRCSRRAAEAWQRGSEGGDGAAGFPSDGAEGEGGSRSPLAQSEITRGDAFRRRRRRGPRVARRHRVEPPGSNPESRRGAEHFEINNNNDDESEICK